MPTVLIPPPYRGPTQGEASIPVEAATVRACLDAVASRYPGFGELVFTDGGELHRFAKLFRNGEPLEKDALDASVEADDEIQIVAAIAGGSL